MEVEDKVILIMILSLPIMLAFVSFSSVYNTTDAVVRVEHVDEIDKDYLFLVSKEYNRTKLFNYTQEEFYNIVDSYPDVSKKEVLIGLTIWVGKNIEYELTKGQQSEYFDSDNPALLVLERKKAVCLGMSILLSNLILAYNESIPTYICFGIMEDVYRNLGHASVICYVDDSYIFLDPVNYKSIDFPESYCIDFFNDRIEFFDMCCLISKDGAYNLER